MFWKNCMLLATSAPTLRTLFVLPNWKSGPNEWIGGMPADVDLHFLEARGGGERDHLRRPVDDPDAGLRLRRPRVRLLHASHRAQLVPLVHGQLEPGRVPLFERVRDGRIPDAAGRVVRGLEMYSKRTCCFSPCFSGAGRITTIESS